MSDTDVQKRMSEDVVENSELYEALADGGDVAESLDEDEAAEEGLFDGQYAVSEDELVREDE